ncbi:subtilisin-like protease [Citrus sinensis]|uniref:Subtilisin-like protease n=1 Tax=Citrus sinensis TaxID=2711 RepID=A0ACB8KZE0_CITSI|nr:subtilisin-like protease [Citrus sinensis]
MASSWRRTIGNLRSFVGNSMGGVRGGANLASWVVAGTLAYYLWVKPSQDLKREQEERAALAALDPNRYVEKRKPIPDPQFELERRIPPYDSKQNKTVGYGVEACDRRDQIMLREVSNGLHSKHWAASEGGTSHGSNEITHCQNWARPSLRNVLDWNSVQKVWVALSVADLTYVHREREDSNVSP